MAKQKSLRLPGEGSAPGCWWGVLHSFGIQEHLHLRKLLGQRRSANRSHATSIELQKAKRHLPPAGDEDYISEDEKGITPQVEYASDSTNKDSGKAQARAVIDREISKQKGMAKRKGQKQKANPFATYLLRTISIHHMECDDYVQPEEMPEDNKAQESLPLPHNSCSSAGKVHMSLSPPRASEVNWSKRCETCGMLTGAGKYFGHNQLDVLGCQLVKNQTLLRDKIRKVKNKFLEHQTSDGKGVKRDAVLDHPVDLLETLEILNANGELLLRLLHEQSVTFTNCFQGQEGSRNGSVLSKSGSFPGAGFSARAIRPLDPKCRSIENAYIKKKDRKSETEISQAVSTIDFTEADKSQVTVDNLKPVSNIHWHSEIASNSQWSSSITHAMKSQKDIGTAVYRFKDIKQRIRDIIKESKDERQRISMDGVLHKIPYGCKVSREKLCPWEVAATSRFDGNGTRNSFSSGGASTAYRRSHSLTESLDRYSNLMESNFSREPKRQISERLRFVPDDNGCQIPKPPRTFGRMLSLPEFDSYFLVEDDRSEASKDLIHSSSTSVDRVQGNAAIHVDGTDEQKMSAIFESSLGDVTEKDASPTTGDPEKSKLDNIIDAASDDIETGNIASAHFEEMVCHLEWSDKPAKPSPISVLDSYLPEDLVSPADFSVLPASSELKPGQAHFEEPEPFNNPQNQADIYDSSMMRTDASIQNPGMQPDYDSLHVPMENIHEFQFVREMLQKYWFDGSDQFGTWDSPPSHQLSSTISEEVEDSVYELKPSSRDSDISLDHGLLYDLTNEVLLEVYEASYGHCPWLTHSCRTRIRPMSVGYHFLEEVWANVSWHLKSQPRASSTLEDTTSQDFKRNDKWMNLHYEIENVGLDLETLIFDDLLDEAISECLDLAFQQ